MQSNNGRIIRPVWMLSGGKLAFLTERRLVSMLAKGGI